MPLTTNCPHQPYCEMREQTDMRFISHLTRNTFAIILAGGRGTRLKQLTDFRSKPAVPFAGKFRILDFTLSNCVNSGHPVQGAQPDPPYPARLELPRWPV